MDEKLKLIARVSNVAVTLSLDGSEALESLPTDQFKRLCTDAGVSDSEEAHEVVGLVFGTDLFGSSVAIESLRLSAGGDHVRDLAKMLYSIWLLDATREGADKGYNFIQMGRMFDKGQTGEFAQPFSEWIGNGITSDLRDALMPVIGKVEGSPAAEPERQEPADQPAEDGTGSEAHDTEADSEDNAETSDTESKADTEADAEDTAETSDTKSDTESKTDAVTEAHDTVTEAHSVEAEASNVDAEASDDGTVTETPANVTERHGTTDQPSDDSAQGTIDAGEDGQSSNDGNEEPAVPEPADDFDELDDASDDDAEDPSQAIRDELLTTTKLPPYDDMDEGSVDPVDIDGSDDDLVDSLGLGEDDDGDDGDNPTTVLNRAAHMASSEKKFYRSVNRMKNIFSDGPRPGLSDEE